MEKHLTLNREELQKNLWKTANRMRGSIDLRLFQHYVLGLICYRFISESMTQHINKKQKDAGKVNFNYEEISDEQAEKIRNIIVKQKGFFVLPSELFINVVKRAIDNQDLNETLKKIFNNIEGSSVGEESEEDVKGLFESLDFNSNELGINSNEKNKRISEMLLSISEIPFGDFSDSSIDVFGDAYEYLMTMFSSEGGKKGGEHFTPQEVSELLVDLAKVEKEGTVKVYDPTCGSGSLLLKYSKVFQNKNRRIKYYGQENVPTTYNLCRMNMFLHNINFNDFDIQRGDTLLQPKHDETFDVIVSNPPYSYGKGIPRGWKREYSESILLNDERYSPAGALAPKSNADWAFTMHIIYRLENSGKAAVLQFPGSLYRTNTKAEPRIRKYFIDQNFIDTVIILPENLFFTTSISVSLIVLRKNKQNDNNVLFIDATKEFSKNPNKGTNGYDSNRLSQTNREAILKLVRDRKDTINLSALVENQKIAENEYIIHPDSYVEKEDVSQKINIDELNKEIDDIVLRQDKLRVSIKAIINDLESKENE